MPGTNGHGRMSLFLVVYISIVKFLCLGKNRKIIIITSGFFGDSYLLCDLRIYTFKFFGDNYLLCDIEYYCLAQSDTDRPHAVSRSDVTD